MALQVNVADFRMWNQAQWRIFFQQYDKLWQVPPADLPLFRSPEFQETMMKVGVFGGARLFDQTPCVWDVETNIGRTFSWTSHPPTHRIDIACFATKLLAGPDDIYEMDQADVWGTTRKKGDVRSDDEGIVIQDHDSLSPIVFVKREHCWCAQPTVRSFRSNRYYSIVDRVNWIFNTFNLAAELFEREKTRQVYTKALLLPMLPSPVADLVCDYASNLAADKRAPERRELRNLTYRTFERAGLKLLEGLEQEDRQTVDFLPSSLFLGPNQLKIISASIVQYVGDDVEENSR